MAGAFTVDSGLVSLNEANTIGSVGVTTGGLLAFGNTGALGAGHGRAKRRRTHRHRRWTSATRSHFRELRGSRPHGTMLYEDAIDAISASTILMIGSLGEGGTILWHTNAGSIITFPVGGIYVQLGTVRGRGRNPFVPSG
jgi:hypothetical protein